VEQGSRCGKLERLQRRNEKPDLTAPFGVRANKVPGVSSPTVAILPSGAELRVRGPEHADAVVGVNGGRRKQVAGTWSASLEWLVDRLAPSFPALRFAEVRYRIKSWERLDWCIEDAREAIETVGAKRTLMLGFSMGGAVSAAAAGEPSVVGVLGLAPWLPERLPLDGLRGKRLRVVHGGFDRGLPGIPGVTPASSRAGFERALALGAEGEYTLLPGGVHGVALRAPWGTPLPLPRADDWLRLCADEVARFAA
jgi:pimeloyl-ACP methyl ester carboxylesterase